MIDTTKRKTKSFCSKGKTICIEMRLEITGKIPTHVASRHDAATKTSPARRKSRTCRSGKEKPLKQGLLIGAGTTQIGRTADLNARSAPEG
ncbi:MAG: hypothetical protein GY896_14240 [Gammaproteobacteria bacterium]|nr:hypothetical protein [Gammaproteobacteria bacterium]